MPKYPSNILTTLNGTNGFVFTDLSTNSFIEAFPIATGDMNGDGVVDFAFADSFVKTTVAGLNNDGHVYVMFGNSSYPASVSAVSNLDGVRGFRVVGVIKRSLGAAVNFIDINKDGYDDLFIGAPEVSKSSQQSDTTGWTHVIYGKSTGGYPNPFNITSLDGTNGFTLGGGAEDEFFGQSIARGDINNDSFQDAIITGNRNTYVLYGSGTAFPSYLNASDIDGTNGFKITGLTAHEANVADLDRDGLPDILLSQQYTINAIFGNATFPATLPVSSLDGRNGFATTPGSGPTRVLAAGGDMNQDGYPDLLIGTTSNIAPGKFSGVFSHARPYPAIVNSLNLNGANGTTFLGLANVDYTGYAVTSGYMGNQLVILTAAPIANNYAGRVTGIYGSTKPFPASLSIADVSTTCKGFTIDGIASTQVGATIAMPDINNDGISDLLIRATSNKAYVVYGKAPQAPVLNLASSATYTENASSLTLDSGLVLNFGDCDYITTITVTITNVQLGDVLAMSSQPNIVATYDAATGTLTLSGNTLASEYQTALRSITFSNPSDTIDPTPRAITFAGSNLIEEVFSANMTLNIVAVNDVPVLTGNNSTLISTDAQAVVIDNSIVVSDVDNTTFVGAQMSIANFVQGDVLGFVNQNGITGQYNSTAGILTLTGTASTANYQTALRSVTYQSNNVDFSDRNISFVVNDGNDNSNTITRSVRWVPLNHLLSGTNDSLLCLNLNQNETLIFPNANIVGGTTVTLNTVTVTIPDFVAVEDSLAFTDLSNGINGNYNAQTGVLTLTGPATADAFQASLRAVKYVNSNVITIGAAKIFAVAADYTGLSSNTLQSAIDLITVNDAPVVMNAIPEMSVTVGQPFSQALNVSHIFSSSPEHMDYEVLEENGDLQAALTFDANTNQLNGTLSEIGTNRFSFFGMDRCGQNASTPLAIKVLPETAIPSSFVQSPPSPESSSHTGAIVGGVVGGLAGLLCVGGIIGGLLWGKRQAEKEDALEMQAMGSDAAVGNNPAYQKKKSWYNALYRSKSFKEAHSRDIGVDNSKTSEPKGP